MARTVKGHDERLDEFLTTARDLFFREGYDATTVQMILDQMGVAKGTFYHYFTSKEDLLDRMVEQMSSEMFAEIEALVERKDLDAVRKLEIFFLTMRRIRMENPKLVVTMVRHILADRNLRFRDKYNQSMINRSLPILEQIIAQGEAEGVFSVSHGEYTAEILLNMMMYYGEVIARQLLISFDREEIGAAVLERMNCLVSAAERILGMKAGSMHIVDPKIIKSFLRNIKESQTD